MWRSMPKKVLLLFIKLIPVLQQNTTRILCLCDRVVGSRRSQPGNVSETDITAARVVGDLVKSEVGRKAISTYAAEVVKVAEHDFGIHLLRLFKKKPYDRLFCHWGYQGFNRSAIEGANLVDLDGLMLLVLEMSQAFEKMGAMLDLKEEANSPETHRKVLQFIGLKQRYQSSYNRFQQLLAAVRNFHSYYQTITDIREKYPAYGYRVPVEFGEELPE